LLVETVWNRNGLNCDIPTLNFIHQFATPVLDMLMVLVTRAGSVKIVLLLTVLSACALAFKRRWRDAAFLLVAVSVALAWGWFFKNAVHRVRPHLWLSPAPEYDFSFPSGHSTGTMSLNGMTS
jgi:undecaprenyl-diphosphatase